MNAIQFHMQMKENAFTPLGDLVYNYLFDQIITMEMLPESRLNEAQIAKQLGVSRSPIRAAIERLIDEQLVIKTQGKYPIIAPVTQEDWIEMTHARTVIESKASYYAAQVIDSMTIEKLKMLASKYDEISKSPTLEGFEKCDHEFHTTIVYACRNKYLIDMYESIQYRVLRYRYNLRQRMPLESLIPMIQNTAQSHWGIIFLLEKRITTVVADEMAQHLDIMRDIFAHW